MNDNASNTDKTKAKWNRIYENQVTDLSAPDPALMLSENQQWLTSEGRALDVGCGRGGNAIFLANHGLEVDAWDISDVAINHLKDYAVDSGSTIRASQIDINEDAFTQETWDVIVICHYLDRLIIPAARKALKPGGLLCMQTFTANKRVNLGPSNSQFLLQANELKQMTQGMEIVAYRDEGSNIDPAEPLAGRAYIIARA